VLPPEGALNKEVEALTGITDSFLRSGGIDSSTGVFHGPAPDFERVYEYFCRWCNDRRGGREICLLAHNARFDVGMLNGEIQRLSSRGSRIPMLGKDANISSVVDTLVLLRSKSLWSSNAARGREDKLPRPSSFKQADVYDHVIGSPMPGAHNAMGDVLGLEAILGSKAVRGSWIRLAQNLQAPLVVIKED
jgi:hypothetical protein